MSGNYKLNTPAGFYTSPNYIYTNPLPAEGIGYSVKIFYSGGGEENVIFTNKKIQSINDISLASSLDANFNFVYPNGDGSPLNQIFYPFLNGSNIVINGGLTTTQLGYTITFVGAQFPPGGPCVFQFTAVAAAPTETPSALVQ